MIFFPLDLWTIRLICYLYWENNKNIISSVNRSVWFNVAIFLRFVFISVMWHCSVCGVHFLFLVFLLYEKCFKYLFLIKNLRHEIPKCKFTFLFLAEIYICIGIIFFYLIYILHKPHLKIRHCYKFSHNNTPRNYLNYIVGICQKQQGNTIKINILRTTCQNRAFKFVPWIKGRENYKIDNVFHGGRSRERGTTSADSMVHSTRDIMDLHYTMYL